MAKFPYLPLYVADFFTKTVGLPWDVKCGYLTLMALAWAQPDNSLPDDDVWICTALAMPKKTWHRLKPLIMKFWTLEEGRWRQRTLDEFREIAKTKSKKNQSSAHARWRKSVVVFNETNDLADANAMRTQCLLESESKIESKIESSPTSENQSTNNECEKRARVKNENVTELFPTDPTMPWPIYEPTSQEFGEWVRLFPCFRACMVEEVRSVQNGLVAAGQVPNDHRRQHAMVESWLGSRARKRAEKQAKAERPLPQGHRRY